MRKLYLLIISTMITFCFLVPFHVPVVAQATAGKIAFMSYRNGSYPEIYIMNADGSNQTQLTYGNNTDNLQSDWNPCLSPDGTKIAFISTRDHAEEIYCMNANGSGLLRLTNNVYSDYDPVWSPDGTKIAFFSTRDGIGNIYLMNSDGTNQTRLTIEGGDKPSWSPDNTKVAFVSRRDSQSDTPVDNIYIINVDGTGETRITDEQPGYIYGISWSPDGNKIIYDSIVPYNPTPGVPDYYSRGLFTIQPDGSGRTALPTTGALQNACRPVWSPDGTYLAFGTTRYVPEEIYTVKADGSELIQLTDTSVGSGSGNHRPSWSFGSWIAPSVSTDAASVLTATTATLNGNLTSLGSAASGVTLSFDWGIDTDYTGGCVLGIPSPVTTIDANGTAFSSNLTGLITGQIYHYRTKAIGDGITYGNDITFIPGSNKLSFVTFPQTVTVGSASNIITVQTQDISSNPTNVSGNTEIVIASTSSTGRFDTDPSGFFDGSITKVNIVDGNNQASFYYKDTKAGISTITVTSIGYSSGTQQENIQSNDATLSSLTLSIGTLSPAFASGTDSYTANVANNISDITVTPKVNESHATVTVNGMEIAGGATSGVINLSVGTNTITIVVTAQDTTTQITYILTVTRADSGTSSSGGGGGGGGGDQDLTITLELEGLNSSSEIKLNLLGKTREWIELTTEDGECTVQILAGTALLDQFGEPLTEISITPLSVYPDPPPETTVIFAYEFQPAGARFTPKLKVTFKYDLNMLPEGTDPATLKIGYWNGSKWNIIEGNVNAGEVTISFETNHFSAYALLYPGAITPAVTTTSTTTTTTLILTTTTTTSVITTTQALPPEVQITPEIIATAITKPETPTTPTTQFFAQESTTAAALSTMAVSQDESTPEAVMNWWLIVLLPAGILLIIVIVCIVIKRTKQSTGQAS